MGFHSRYNDVYDKFERLCSTCPYDNTFNRERRKAQLSRYYYRGHRTDDGEWIDDKRCAQDGS